MAKAGKNKQDTGYIDLFAEEEELSSEDFEETEDLFPQEKKARSGFSLFKQNKKQKKRQDAPGKRCAVSFWVAEKNPAACGNEFSDMHWCRNVT